MKSVKMKFVNRLLFIFLPLLLSAGAILVMMWNYAGWWDCSHYDCMLDELHLHHMRVAGDECINKSPEDFVFIVNADLSMVWQLSMSKISLEGLLDLCSCEGGSENCCRTRLFFLLDERAPEHEVAKLLQRVTDVVGDRVYIVGLCAGRFVDKIGFSMLCPAGMSCHACCRACVKWRGFPLDVNNAQRVIAYLPAGAREVALE